MKLSSSIFRVTGFALLLGMACAPAYAASPAVFVDHASAKSIAVIQTSQLALEKSQSEDVKSFAQLMIKDHTDANQKLVTVAKALKVPLARETELMDRAKNMILQYRGASFDNAYASNQVKAHEAIIQLFEDEIRTSQTPALTAFAKETLLTLQEHLKMAKQLQAKYNE
jgi:putative membrane protein